MNRRSIRPHENGATYPLRLHTISSLADPLYDDWLDIYQRSFPLEQQLLVSAHNRTIRSAASGGRNARYAVCLDDSVGACVGMAHFEAFTDYRASALWYLAVSPEHRNKGIGGWMYGATMNTLRADYPACRACVIEVELPHRCADPVTARRRIAFYERLGAVWLRGCAHVVDVGWQPSVTMGVMVHPFERLTEHEMRACAASVLGELLADG